jgi:hypothetical protein
MEQGYLTYHKLLILLDLHNELPGGLLEAVSFVERIVADFDAAYDGYALVVLGFEISACLHDNAVPVDYNIHDEGKGGRQEGQEGQNMSE